MGPFELMDLIGIDINLRPQNHYTRLIIILQDLLRIQNKSEWSKQETWKKKKTGKGFLSSVEQRTPLTVFTPEEMEISSHYFQIINSIETSFDQSKKIIGELDPSVKASGINAFISRNFSKNNAIELINIDLSIDEIQQLSNEMLVEIVVLPEGSKTFVLLQ